MVNILSYRMRSHHSIINNLYTLSGIEKNNNGCIYKITLNPDNPIYKGHFPDKPVTPGVCLMAMVLHCASDFLKRDLRYGSIKECKFIDAVLPENPNESIAPLPLQAELQITPLTDTPETWNLKAQLSVEGKSKLKIRAQLITL